MKNFKKALCLILIPILIVTGFCSCSVKKNDLIGKWYKDENHCLDVRSDGTWTLDGLFGSGTWEYLDDGETIEFTDTYGEVYQTTIDEDENGKYVTLKYYGRYYKDAYPSGESVDSSEKENGNSHSSQNANPIDAFKGIEYEISGISPYCKITINTSNCSLDAQKNITYSLDKEFYANGDTAKITATLTNSAKNSYKLINTESEVTVSGQPEYLTSVDSDTLKIIQSELDDWITSNVAEAIKAGQNGYLCSNLLGCNVHSEMKSVKGITLNSTYFSTEKTNKKADNKYKNMLSFVYSAQYIGRFESGTVYSSITAVNIIKYPDGSIKWGTKNSDEKDFVAAGIETGGIENCITTLIMCNSSDYNISKVDF